MLRLALVAMIAGLAAACAVVKPHQREWLAHPALSVTPWPDVARGVDETLQTREAARGATNAGGGGCGCN